MLFSNLFTNKKWVEKIVGYLIRFSVVFRLADLSGENDYQETVFVHFNVDQLRVYHLRGNLKSLKKDQDFYRLVMHFLKTKLTSTAKIDLKIRSLNAF